MTYKYLCPKHGEFEREFEFGRAPQVVECCGATAHRMYDASFARPWRATK